jgi:hypothetical protein
MLLIDIQCLIVHIGTNCLNANASVELVPYLSSNSQTTVEKVALNSLKEIVPGLSLNFTILPEELLTSMVEISVEVTACNGVYGDGVKVGAAIGVPH